MVTLGSMVSIDSFMAADVTLMISATATALVGVTRAAAMLSQRVLSSCFCCDLGSCGIA